ncbi:hypothetical protein OHB54_20985 [Streptomyces sp. NBC_01007]|nr:hypothetical protein OHB54_20985 [Streptomyces sp. NBC_01007]
MPYFDPGVTLYGSASFCTDETKAFNKNRETKKSAEHRRTTTPTPTTTREGTPADQERGPGIVAVTAGGRLSGRMSP